jgi:transcriptional regulator NrdR family protein
MKCVPVTCPNPDCHNLEAKVIKARFADGPYYNESRKIIACDKCGKAFKEMKIRNVTELEVREEDGVWNVITKENE